MPEKIAHFPRAYADIARGNVRIRADVAIQLVHKALTKRHHFSVGFAFGVEIGTALTAADGKRGEAVFKDLFQAEEFDDGQIDGGVETQSSLVGTDRAVELHAIALVYVYVAVVVHPRHAEQDRAFGFGEALQKSGFFIFGVRIDNGLQRQEDLRCGLVKFLFTGVALF